MKYYTSSDLAEIQALEAKIHQSMIDNIKDYSATKWSEIYKHPTLALYVLPIKDSDPRLPLEALKETEKIKCVDTLDPAWYVTKTVDGFESKTLEKASKQV